MCIRQLIKFQGLNCGTTKQLSRDQATNTYHPNIGRILLHTDKQKHQGGQQDEKQQQ